MSSKRIKRAVESVITYLSQQPGEARGSDSLAVAHLEEGLRFRAVAPDGAEIFTDMSRAIGGGETAPPPGWLLRAALATCDASVIVIRAAQVGVELDKLEVAVVSESDDRGLLGMDDDITAGPLMMHTTVRIRANRVSPEILEDIVRWAEAHSPVGEAIRRAVPSRLELEIG